MFACYMYVQTLTLTPSPLLRRCVMINSSFLIGRVQTSNLSWILIHWIKDMKSSASELIRNACFNLEGLNRSSCLSKAGILTLDRPLERLWSRRWTFLVPNANCMNRAVFTWLSENQNQSKYTSQPKGVVKPKPKPKPKPIPFYSQVKTALTGNKATISDKISWDTSP